MVANGQPVAVDDVLVIKDSRGRINPGDFYVAQRAYCKALLLIANVVNSDYCLIHSEDGYTHSFAECVKVEDFRDKGLFL